MKNNFWNKKIPTMLGLFLLVIGIGVTSYLSIIGVSPFGHAAPLENPKGLRITNVTDTSFTVTYTTDASVIGSLNVGKTSNLGDVALDDRDQAQGVPTPHRVHSITVRNLSPKIQYFFSITSGATNYFNGTIPFTVTIAPIMSAEPTTQVPLAGRIIFGENDTEALLYVTAANGQTLSTIVKSTGLYALPLNTMRTKDLIQLRPLDKTSLQLLVRNNTDQSRISIASDKRNPVPTITFGQDYDFTMGASPVASTSATFVAFPVFALDTTVVATPEIVVPQKDETFTDTQPVFQGKAVPNTTVNISIHSNDVINLTTKTDSNGNWSVRPAAPLAPGQHTITITTMDAEGIIKKIQQSFTVYAQGSQVDQTATPSATAIPTPTSIPTATPLPIATNTPFPTIVPTMVPTIAPTVVPTSTQLGSISPKLTLPPTGNDSAVTAGVAGLATTAVGLILFMITRGASL